MDGWRVPHSRRPDNPTGNDGHRKPRCKKYHIEFGAAKCKEVRIGAGQESKIMLNNTVLEEVSKYKYLGKIYNTKGNLEEHLKDLETKTMAATNLYRVLYFIRSPAAVLKCDSERDNPGRRTFTRTTDFLTIHFFTVS